GFLWDWIRVRSSHSAYFHWPYFTAGLICLLASGLGLGLAARAISTKRLCFIASVASLFLGLASGVILPDVGPRVDMAGANQKILGHADHSLSDWDEANGQFPSSEEELRKALAVRPLQEPAIYFRQDKPIPYDVQIVTNATGPFTGQTPPNPGTVVYAVSSNYKDYWLTMTTLRYPLGGAVTWEHVAGDFELEPIWVMHRKHHNAGEGYQPFVE
ncbi:MAG TPA: hypothetical protein VMB03_09660, partial [Bryobacteraceae bacterium]|nr:hypothetical protein [Bryobacteraceae bacterium]